MGSGLGSFQLSMLWKDADSDVPVPVPGLDGGLENGFIKVLPTRW